VTSNINFTLSTIMSHHNQVQSTICGAHYCVIFIRIKL